MLGELFVPVLSLGRAVISTSFLFFVTSFPPLLLILWIRKVVWSVWWSLKVNLVSERGDFLSKEEGWMLGCILCELMILCASWGWWVACSAGGNSHSSGVCNRNRMEICMWCETWRSNSPCGSLWAVVIHSCQSLCIGLCDGSGKHVLGTVVMLMPILLTVILPKSSLFLLVLKNKIKKYGIFVKSYDSYFSLYIMYLLVSLVQLFNFRNIL